MTAGKEAMRELKVGESEMDEQWCGENRLGDTSKEAEATFREMLQRLIDTEASEPEISRSVIQSPFVLGLISEVTSKSRVTCNRQRTPEDWWYCLAMDPDLREAWRCETLCGLGTDCRRKGMPNCDLNRPDFKGFWAVVIRCDAINAAHRLWRQSRIRVPHKRGQESEPVDEIQTVQEKNGKKGRRKNSKKTWVRYVGDNVDKLYKCGNAKDYHLGMNDDGTIDGVESWRAWREMKAQEESNDRLIDLEMAIGRLEDPWQREIMMLARKGYGYQEIATILGKEAGIPSK